MKRFLLITSAVGLCLAAPAFAQTTTQDQMNRQGTTQQPSATPSQQQSQQPSSGSSNAQAPRQPQSAQNPPADQNQGRAQNQRQPAPSTNAQAPASSNQPSSAGNESTSQRGQAQNQQPSSNMNAQAPADQQQPKRSATDRNRPAQSGQANQQTRQDRRQNAQRDRQNAQRDRQNAQSDRMQNRQQRRDSAQSRDSNRSSASLNVNINETQRTRIASVIRSSNVRPISVNFRIATGVVVPRSVVLHPVSSSIVEIVPEYRGYSYFVTNEQIVIVEPRKKTIVAVLPAGGEAARAQAPASSRTTFSQQQREVIHSRASTLRTSETVGLSGPIVVEEEIPTTVELQEFPTEIVTEVPTISTYRYFRQGSDIVVVDPGPRRVIEVIR